MQRQLTTLRQLFPSAVLYFVVPSEFYGDTLIDDESELSDRLLKDAVKKFNKETSDEVVFIRQPFYPSKEFLCDGIHHANDHGRTWRTNKLLEQMAKEK